MRVNICPDITSSAAGIFALLALSCNHNADEDIDINPKHFKVQTAFILDHGILVNTYIGSEKKHHVFYLDSHSPSWIKSPVIQYNNSFKKSKGVTFKTSTADGSAIHGDVGICDSLFFAGIAFTNVPFYIMPRSPRDGGIVDGVFGIDAMSKAVWKIDFTKSELTCASDIDSIKEINQAEIFPATFAPDAITVNVDFGHNEIKKMGIDFGFDGDILLPVKDFKNAASSNKRFAKPGRFNTPAGEKIVNNVSVIDTVSINHSWFLAMVSSNETATERLIGLAFFRRFDYVIFDFINKRIYIPKRIW